MSQHPYRGAQRVSLIIHNGSTHRGRRPIDRPQGAWPNLGVALTPNDVADLAALEHQPEARALQALGTREHPRAEPIERIAPTAAVAEGSVLDPMPDLIQAAVGEAVRPSRPSTPACSARSRQHASVVPQRSSREPKTTGSSWSFLFAGEHSVDWRPLRD